MDTGTWPRLIRLLNLFRKLFGCLSKMRNHYISMEVNSRVIVTQKVKMRKEAHLHQEILTRVKSSVRVVSRPDREQKRSNISFLECAPFKCILFPFLRPMDWRWRRKPRLLSGGMEWDKVLPNVPLPTLPSSSCFILSPALSVPVPLLFSPHSKQMLRGPTERYWLVKGKLDQKTVYIPITFNPLLIPYMS